MTRNIVYKNTISNKASHTVKGLPVRVFITGCVILIAVLYMYFIFSGKVLADDQSGPSSAGARYTSILIQPGDTLETIAGQYMPQGFSSVSEYVDYVKTINQMDDDTIYAGNSLLLRVDQQQ